MYSTVSPTVTVPLLSLSSRNLTDFVPRTFADLLVVIIKSVDVASLGK